MHRAGSAASSAGAAAATTDTTAAATATATATWISTTTTAAASRCRLLRPWNGLNTGRPRKARNHCLFLRAILVDDLYL